MSRLLLSIILLSFLGVISAERILKCRINQFGICTFLYETIKVSEEVSFEVTNAQPDQVRSIEFYFSVINRLPANFFTTFKNLESLLLSDQNMLSLEPGTFKDAKNLKSFMANNNQFSELKENVFDGANNLAYILLMNCNIERVHEKVFEGLENLVELNMMRNKITEIPKNLFATNKNLKTLSIAFNQIRVLPQGLFANNLNLQFIQFFENSIDSIYNRMFSHLSDLILLDLTGNKCVDHVYLSTEPKEIEIDLRKCMIPTFLDYHKAIQEQFEKLDKLFKDLDTGFKTSDERIINIAMSISSAGERLNKIEESLERKL